MKRVGAVICNFNKKEDVLNCIQSVLESKYTDYDLYVVDNASSDSSAEAIREKYRFFSFGDAMFIADLKGEK